MITMTFPGKQAASQLANALGVHCTPAKKGENSDSKSKTWTHSGDFNFVHTPHQWAPQGYVGVRLAHSDDKQIICRPYIKVSKVRAGSTPEKTAEILQGRFEELIAAALGAQKRAADNVFNTED